MNVTEISSLIPHRHPFLLVDRIIDFKKGESIVGIKNVSINEQFFVGHFPGNPIMPGVLIIEALAQVSGVLGIKTLDYSSDNQMEKEVYLMSIESAKFRKIVVPGDVLYLHSKIEQIRSSICKFSAKAKVNEDVVTESLFTAVIKDKNNN